MFDERQALVSAQRVTAVAGVSQSASCNCVTAADIEHFLVKLTVVDSNVLQLLSY